MIWFGTIFFKVSFFDGQISENTFLDQIILFTLNIKYARLCLNYVRRKISLRCRAVGEFAYRL
jgi:hypothetical protein